MSRPTMTRVPAAGPLLRDEVRMARHQKLAINQVERKGKDLSETKTEGPSDRVLSWGRSHAGQRFSPLPRAIAFQDQK